jgi:adenine/guanine phosphoribosyltransferase-like PRPP-binding protein
MTHLGKTLEKDHLSLSETSPDVRQTPRSHLESLYEPHAIVIPEWLLRRRPNDTQEWQTLGEFLPALVLPIFRRLIETAPTRLIACARSGIPLGDAVQSLADAFDQPIPSADNRVHTYKISAATSLRHQRTHIRSVIDDALAEAPGSSSIAVMDGVVNKGETFHRMERIAAELGGHLY